MWSVVIPLYNKEAYIIATLRSVIGQLNGKKCEILVIDDGSSDAGAELVSEFGHPMVRLIRQANAGVAAARNTGIRESIGDWVVFLDADDLLHPQAIEAYSNISSKFPAADVVGGKDIRVNSGGLDDFNFSPLPDPLPCRSVWNLADEFLKRGLPFSSSSVAIRRKFLIGNQLAFPEGESMGEDLDMWFRAAELTSLAVTPVGLAAYRVGLPTSLMGSYRDLTLLPVWMRMRDRAAKGLMRADLRRSSLRLVAEMQVTLARKLAKAGRVRDAWKHLYGAREAVSGHRWWVTFVALASCSQKLVSRLR